MNHAFIGGRASVFVHLNTGEVFLCPNKVSKVLVSYIINGCSAHACRNICHFASDSFGVSYPLKPKECSLPKKHTARVPLDSVWKHPGWNCGFYGFGRWHLSFERDNRHRTDAEKKHTMGLKSTDVFNHLTVWRFWPFVHGWMIGLFCGGDGNFECPCGIDNLMEPKVSAVQERYIYIYYIIFFKIVKLDYTKYNKT